MASVRVCCTDRGGENTGLVTCVIVSAAVVKWRRAAEGGSGSDDGVESSCEMQAAGHGGEASWDAYGRGS